MAEIIMPKMGDAMTEGKVVRWYKKQGDTVKKGEPLLEIETDKVNLDLEAEEDGPLGEILVQEGSMVDVGTVLAVIGGEAPAKGAKKKPEEKEKAEPAEDAPQEEEDGEPQEPAPDEKAPKKKETEPRAEQPPQDDAKKQPAPAPEAKPEKKAGKEEAAAAAGDGKHVRSSPLARKMAGELGVDIASLSGSGPSGRVVAADVKKAAEGGGKPAAGKVAEASASDSRAPREKSALPEYRKLKDESIPLTAMRRTIAKRLAESIGPIPHFFLTIEADVTELQKVREQLSEISGAKLSINDFVVRATALAIHHHPIVNASFTAEAIEQHGNVHVGIAVATPEGLITPVIRDADGKSVADIAAEVRDLAGRARNRKLKPDEYQGSTITISNLGMFGIEEFTAVINPPNVAILAVGAAEPKPVVMNGRVRVRERMRITMSCDHRVVDGAAGAQYLQTLKVYLEQPLRLVV
jgi:pyruvate dehydrogenase E2 component (dihydrolipoamide acetyltransferase)